MNVFLKQADWFFKMDIFWHSSPFLRKNPSWVSFLPDYFFVISAIGFSGKNLFFYQIIMAAGNRLSGVAETLRLRCVGARGQTCPPFIYFTVMVIFLDTIGGLCGIWSLSPKTS